MIRLLSLLQALIAFTASVAAVVIVARSPLGQWGRETLGRPYLEYLSLAIVPSLAILLHRAPLSAYGFNSEPFGRQLDISVRCLIPFAVGKAVLFPLGPRQGVHSLVEPIVVLVVILFCARAFRLQTTTAAGAPFLALPFTSNFTVTPLIFYPLFLAPAEELLFRGYIQSRLNLAFGRPFRFLGAGFGWSLPITAAFFSAFHFINIAAIAHGQIDLQWSLVVPTFAWGLALGYLRERSESLLAPIVCHGVPQAIAWAFLGR